MLADTRLPVVPVALAFAVVPGRPGGARLRRDALALPASSSRSASRRPALLIGLYVATDDPALRRRPRLPTRPSSAFTWAGFATYVTVLCVANLTLVTNVADFCRYTPTRRDMRIGLIASAASVVALTTFLGGYVAVAAGETNPFVAVAQITSNRGLLVLLLLAIVVMTLGPQHHERLHGRTLPRQRAPGARSVRATIVVGAIAIVLSAFPDLIERAQDWITHLGNVAAPITGVILADYLVRQRRPARRSGALRPRGPLPLRRGASTSPRWPRSPSGSSSTTRSRTTCSRCCGAWGRPPSRISCSRLSNSKRLLRRLIGCRGVLPDVTAVRCDASRRVCGKHTDSGRFAYSGPCRSVSGAGSAEVDGQAAGEQGSSEDDRVFRDRWKRKVDVGAWLVYNQDPRKPDIRELPYAGLLHRMGGFVVMGGERKGAGMGYNEEFDPQDTPSSSATWTSSRRATTPSTVWSGPRLRRSCGCRVAT